MIRSVSICVTSLAVLLFLQSSSQADLVAHYRFDEVGGTAVIDSVGGINGSFVNSPTRVTGIAGKALQMHDNASASNLDYAVVN